MAENKTKKTPKDPLYPRIVLTPMKDGWLVEVDYTPEYCEATGPFDDIYDALHAGMIRLDKQSAYEEDEEDYRGY